MNNRVRAAVSRVGRILIGSCVFLVLGVFAHAQIAIQPITTRPCLLSGPEDVPDIKARLVVHPMTLESLLNNYLYGTPAQKQAANDQFFTYPGSGDGNGLLQTYVGERGRRLVEDLTRYDIALGLGLATDAQKNQMRSLALDFVHTTFGTSQANFPQVGVNNGNLWLENVIALGFTALNFPDESDAQMWITQAVAYMDYEIGAEFLDGAARESPRYHDWEMLHLSNFLTALKRRTGVDRYDNPALKQAIEWYARFASPPLSVANSQPIIPAWGDATYSETAGKQFYSPALFAPAYATRDPYFSARLMYWWKRAGSPDYTQQAFRLTNPQILDPRLPDSPQAARTSFYSPALGEAVLRIGSEDPDEMTATFICGPPGISHENSDNGHIDLFAFGVPLALDSMSGPYDASNDTWNSRVMAHNTVSFQGQDPTGNETPNGTFNAFGSSDIADYVVGNTKYGTTSVRHVVFVKPDYLVVWDQCAAKNYSDFWMHTPAQSLEWQSHKVISHTPWNVDLDVDFLLPSDSIPQPTIPAANPTSDYTTRNTVASAATDPGAPALYTTQGEGRFGEWTNPDDNSLGRNPFTFKRQTFFTVRAPAANGHYLTVWHPRKVGVTPALTTTLLSATSTSVTLTVDFNGRTDTIAIDTNGATVTKGGAGTVQFAETYPQSGVSGAARYVKSSYATTTLTSALATTGTVEVTMGTLALGASERIQDTAPLHIRPGGTFALGAFNETVGDFLLDGGTLSGSGTLHVANVEFWGGTLGAPVVASGSFHKKGATAWTLANLSYAGDTYIDGGTLSLPSSLPGTQNLHVATGAVLDLNTPLTLPSGTNSTISGSVTGTGSLVNNGTLTLVGSGTLPAGMSFTNNGTLDVTQWSGALPTGFVNNGTVLARPTITTQPQNQTVAAGHNAQFTIAAAGTGAITYQWYFNGLALTDGGNISGATTATLTLTGVVAADAGNYTCVASNFGGGATSNAATLTVDTTAPAGTIVSDPFTDGSRSNTSGGDLRGVQFFSSQASSTLAIADDSAGIGSGNALIATPVSTSLKVIAEFNTVTLAQAGSFVQLQFDFRYTQTPDAAAGNFRFGLYQIGTTHTTADSGNSARNDDVGYGFTTNPGAAVSASNHIISEAAGDDILGGSAPGNAVNFTGTGTSTTSANLGTTKHTAQLLITRQSNGDLVISGSIDGVTASATHAAASVLTYAFNEIGIANGSTTKPFAIDNVTVTTNNPPQINITSPTSGIVFSTSAATLDLSGIATDDAAVTQVTWTNNRGGSGTATGTSTWSISAIPLSIGVNVINVTASNAAGYSSTATLTVTRSQPGTLEFSAATYQLNESAGIATISVTRAAGSDGAVSIAYDTEDGTASAGTDYAATSGTLNWASGDTATRTFSIPLLPGNTTSGDLTVNLALASPTGSATLGSPANAVLTIHHTPTDHWRLVHFGANANTAAISGDLANPSGDGVVNLLKYAFGLDPALSGNSGLPVLANDGAYLTLTYTRVIADSDITYQAQWADDLHTWSTSGITEEILSDDGITRQIKAKIPLNSAPHRFLRLNITRP